MRTRRPRRGFGKLLPARRSAGTFGALQSIRDFDPIRRSAPTAPRHTIELATAATLVEVVRRRRG
jgi:hypothetical protein